MKKEKNAGLFVKIFLIFATIYSLWFYISFYVYNFSYMSINSVLLIFLFILAIYFTVCVIGIIVFKLLELFGVDFSLKNDLAIYNLAVSNYSSFIKNFTFKMEMSRKKRLKYLKIETLKEKDCILYNMIPRYRFIHNVQYNYSVFKYQKIECLPQELLTNIVNKVNSLYEDSLLPYQVYIIYICVDEENEYFKDLISNMWNVHSYYNIIQIVGISFREKKVYIPFSNKDWSRGYSYSKLRRTAREILNLKYNERL